MNFKIMFVYEQLPFAHNVLPDQQVCMLAPTMHVNSKLLGRYRLAQTMVV